MSDVVLYDWPTFGLALAYLGADDGPPSGSS
jgi:hypothetical protein